MPVNQEVPESLAFRLSGVSLSGVVKVSCVAAATIVVVGNQHLSVLVGPEAVEVNQDTGDSITLATIHQILKRDLIGVFGLHHVEYFILRRNRCQNVQFLFCLLEDGERYVQTG